jgi:hypothetical protein
LLKAGFVGKFDLTKKERERTQSTIVNAVRMFAPIFLSNLYRKGKKRNRNRERKKKNQEQTFLRSSLLAAECKRKIREARSSFN